MNLRTDFLSLDLVSGIILLIAQIHVLGKYRYKSRHPWVKRIKQEPVEERKAIVSTLPAC